MLFVFPAGRCPSGAVETPARALVAPSAADIDCLLPDGHAALTTNPMGFDLLELRFSPNALVRDGAEPLAQLLEQSFVAAVCQLAPDVAYYTRYGLHLDDAWIEGEVLA